MTEYEVNDHPTDASRATSGSPLLGLGVREPIDDFERTLVNAYRQPGSVAAIWVRETQAAPGEDRHTRRVWIQLSLWVPEDLRMLDRINEEMRVRAMGLPWYTEVDRFVGDMPPFVVAVAPACIWQRPA